MNLDKYMSINNYSGLYVANKIGLTKSMISKLRSRERSPSLEIAIKLVDLSKGQITFKELVKK